MRQVRSPSASPVSARSKSAGLFGINLECGALGFFLGLRALPFNSVSPDGAGN